MYQPFVAPNSYRRCKVAEARLQRVEEGPSEAQGSEAASSNFLADALTTLDTSVGRAEHRPTPVAAAPVALNASAEELHRHRVSRSAALGIQSAVEMEKDTLEMEHKRRKLDGTDTKSRIASMLSRMRKTSAEDTQGRGDSAPSPTSSGVGASPPQPVSEPTAPLVFKPSPLAAGGYVMVAGEQRPKTSQGPAAGKPSSTLLVRWARASPLPAIQQLPKGGAEDMALGQVAEQVRAECGRHGVVRGARAHVLTTTEEEAMAEVVKGGVADPDRHAEQLLRERLRVLVRFDTVTDAFKAAESLCRTRQEWCVCFFPTARYDAGDNGPTSNEPLCGA